MVGAPKSRCSTSYSKKSKHKTPVLRLLGSRELGSHTKLSVRDVPESAFRLPRAWKRRAVNPGTRNKIFAAQWITDNHVVYGTKCNHLVLYDCTSNESFDIPLIKPPMLSPGYDHACSCGVHAIQLNPSQTLLATGGANVNDVGVYTLADLSPHCLLKDCHKDWVFDLRWLDDSYLVSCSRDSSLAMWRIPSFENDLSLPCVDSSIHNKYDKSPLPCIQHPVAHAVSSIPNDRFRAVEHLMPFNLLTVVSMSRRLYLYDAVRMGLDRRTQPVFTLALRDAYQEAVALRRWPSNPNCVALATHHCVILFDIRCADPIGATGRCIHPPLAVSGVRSLNFADSVLSYGTSNGQVHFYDLRGNQHLPTHLDVGPGWVKPHVCNEDEIVGSPDRLDMDSSRAWPAQAAEDPVPGWGAPPPSPSPAQSILFSQSSVAPSFSGPSIAQLNNLRLRLDRIHHRLSGLRERHLAMTGAPLIYSVSGLRTVDPDRAPTASSERRPAETPPNEPMTSSGGSSRPATGLNLNTMITYDSGENEDDDVLGGSDSSTLNSNGVEDRFSAARTSIWRLPAFSFVRPRPFAMTFPLSSIFPDFDSFPTISAQRNMLAVYTHEYDPSGTRLFTGGGPIASTFHGNVAALWE
ncbi:unnamed protein product [Calicophoron daubneyi]|uniref:DDB1- and CUL4-associated factor 12 beta-propeller domain-containing protein n=1 Tax=Calicophoron daubneyi TaxID=300641 RepID=A0AAV2TPU8_CALDB